MPKIIHDFRVTTDFAEGLKPYSGGLNVSSNDEVRMLSELSGLPLWALTQNDLRMVLEIDEKDPRLGKLYEAIWVKYRLKPSCWNIIPKAEQSNYFGVRRKVTWTKKEIDACEMLWLRHKLTIANNRDATPEQWQGEEYVAGVDEKQHSAVQFGGLCPFTGLAVAEPLRTQLLESGLKGLYLPPVTFVPPVAKVRKLLWALKSTVILPRPLNLLQGEHGSEPEPNTEWACWWDDGGKRPEVLKFRRSEVQAVGPFDIAMTYERVGITVQGAFRQCLVTQRFREVMTQLKVKGVDYVPVELV